VANGAVLEDKVEIVGALIHPAKVTAGEGFRVQLQFKVLDDMDVDYVVFVHVEDADGRSERINADHKPANGMHPTTQWKKGEVVKDEFQVYVPPGMPARTLNMLVGFWDPKTDARLRLKNVDKVKSDGNNRILIAQIPVESL
jgi:hypothetical protein